MVLTLLLLISPIIILTSIQRIVIKRESERYQSFDRRECMVPLGRNSMRQLSLHINNKVFKRPMPQVFSI